MRNIYSERIHPTDTNGIDRSQRKPGWTFCKTYKSKLRLNYYQNKGSPPSGIDGVTEPILDILFRPFGSPAPKDF